MPQAPNTQTTTETIVAKQDGAHVPGRLDAAASSSSAVVKIEARAELTREYAYSTGRDITSAIIRALPQYISDLDRVFGSDLWQRMHGDPQTSSTVNILRASAVSKGFRLTIGEDIPEDEQDEAQGYVDFCQAFINDMKTPLSSLMWELSACVYLGYQIAEMVFENVDMGGQSGPRLVPTRIKVKPHNTVAIVTDDRHNILGYLPAKPGQYTSPTYVNVDTEGNIPGLLDPQKFVLVTNDPQHNDPRGTSAYRQVYDAWWHKRQLLPEYLQFLSTQAIPSAKGILPEGAKPYTLDGVTVDPMDDLIAGLEGIRNGGVIGLPFGADADYLQVQSQGDVFIKAFEFYDKQIAKGITGQILATEEAGYDTLGASQTHQDVLAMPSDRLNSILTDALRNGVLKTVMLLNFGEEKARRFTPSVLSGETEQQDFGGMATALSTLRNAGMLDQPDQIAAAYEKLGLPFDKVAYVEQQAAKQTLAAQIRGAAGSDDEDEGDEAQPQPPVPPQGQDRGDVEIMAE